MRRSLGLFVIMIFVGCAGGEDETPAASADGGVISDAFVEETSTDSSVPDDALPDAAPESGPPVDVATLDQQFADAICGRLTACCASDEYTAFFQRFQTSPFTLPMGSAPTPADCASTVKTQLGILHGKWAASVKRGRMTFDPVKGKACVDAIAGATCGTPLATALFDGTCFDIRSNTIFQKIAKVGSPCEDIGDTTFNGECDPAEGYCDGPPSKVTDRKCVAWKKPGEDCSVTPTWAFCDSVKGSACDGMTTTKPGKCSDYGKTVALGEDCTAIDGPFLDCAMGSWCDFSSGKCAAKKPDGAACTTDDECATAHARTCYARSGAATCGSSAWCSGATSDGGVDATSDTSAADTSVSDTAAADTPETMPAAPFTIERTDDATPLAGATVTAGARDRVTLRWDVAGATTVSLAGAGDLVALVTDGTPTWDDLTASGGGLDRWEKTTSLTSTVHGATLPAGFSPSILGDTWSGSIAISARGVISRSSFSASVSNPALPIPSSGFSSADWADGTIAAFMDPRIDVQSTSKLRYARFGTGADARAVVEWNDLTITPENGTKRPLHLTFQAAIKASGEIELRYQTLAVDAGSAQPIGDLALARGQSAVIGLASSSGDVVGLSLRRPSLVPGVTYTFTKATALPAKGRAIVVLPKTTGSKTFTLANGATTWSVSADVQPMYSQTVGTGTVRDISTEAAVKTLTSLPALVEVPFALGTFHEGWTALSVNKGAIHPYGAVGQLLANDRPIPSTYSPNAIVAAAMPLSSSSWCGGAHYALTDGIAPNREVIVLMKGVYRCGTTSSETLDVETTLFENGNVEVVYGNVLATSSAGTGESLVAGLENGNGDVGYEAFHGVAGSITNGKKITWTRLP